MCSGLAARVTIIVSIIVTNIAIIAVKPHVQRTARSNVERDDTANVVVMSV